MSYLYTVVSSPDHDGYMSVGRVSRAEAIAEARAHFEWQRDEAARWLATDEATLHVQVQRGVYRVRVVEVLP